MEVIGWFACLLIGVSLGLLGGGGSILTVPVLVYLFSQPPSVATAYSLFVVGSTALVGSITFMRRGEVSLRATIAFAVPSLIAVFLTRRILLPALPQELFWVGGAVVTKDLAVLVLFALLMLVAGIKMIKGTGKQQPVSAPDGQPFRVALIGLVVGLLAGLVGAGGGFLIIPALVLVVGLPMKTAVGTSLLIIAIQSLIGFTGDVAAGTPMDWSFLLRVAGLAILGILIGSAMGRGISGDKLKPAFGWFVLTMALFILIKELAL